jgi:ubiquinone biosynthesis protein
LEFHALSKLNRFKTIIITLLRYGFDDLIDRLDIQDIILPFKIKKAPQTKNTWERIRCTLEELGPTFIKFGQVLSLRTDLIPIPLSNELSKLQDEVPPEDSSAIRQHVESILGQPLNEVFSFFEETPLAAASLAQVHRARLRENNQVVAVKVQRPNIQQTVENDLYILEVFARRIHEKIEALRFYDIPNLVKELKRTLLQEIDFSREYRNLRIAASNFAQNSFVIIPKVFEKYSCKQILVMELLQGQKLKNLDKLDQESRKHLAQKGMQACMQQLLIDGFFHADPHPGNILIMEEGKFSFLDWGMVGRITPETRFKLMDLIQGIVEKDSDAVLDCLNFFSRSQISGDIISFHKEVMDIMDTYHYIPLHEVHIGQLLMELTTLMRNYHIRIRTELAIMIKAIITIEGTARKLYPELNVVAEAEPFIKRIAQLRYSPKMIWKKVKRNLTAIASLQQKLPHQFNHIIEQLDRGELAIGLEHRNLSGLSRSLEGISNRLTLGIITAAMIIGSSMIITTGVKPLLFGYPALGLVGYLISACFGLWLIIDIFRHRNK